jgi:hypothetical protein
MASNEAGLPVPLSGPVPPAGLVPLSGLPASPAGPLPLTGPARHALAEAVLLSSNEAKVSDEKEVIIWREKTSDLIPDLSF